MVQMEEIYVWQTAHVCFKHEPENTVVGIKEVKDDEVKKILSKMSDVLCGEVGMSWFWWFVNVSSDLVEHHPPSVWKLETYL